MTILMNYFFIEEESQINAYNKEGDIIYPDAS